MKHTSKFRNRTTMVTFPIEGTKSEALSRTSWGKFYIKTVSNNLFTRLKCAKENIPSR